MNPNELPKIHFEHRIEMGYDDTIIETFPDGSQLIHKKGHLILVDSAYTFYSNYRMPANPAMFSKN